MTQVEYEMKLKDIQDNAKKKGFQVELFPIDKDHLAPIWYCDEVGSLKIGDYTIVIGAYGETRLNGLINGEEVSFVDKGCGSALSHLDFVHSDEELYKYLYSKDFANYLCFDNNNWFEYNIIDKDGNFLDMFWDDNVLDDDILECFTNLDYYEEVIRACTTEV